MDNTTDPNGFGNEYHDDFQPRDMPNNVLDDITRTAEENGGPYQIPEDERDAIGRSMFDTPSSKDNHIVVLTPPDNIEFIPSQALLHIRSKKPKTGEVDREYIGIVTEGPFSEPDGLKADSPIMVSANVRGGILMPNYHGRANVEILGELVQDDKLMPPRFRPLPNSAVFPLSDERTAHFLGLQEGIQLGLVMGYSNLEFGISPTKKQVLPRHVGVLGTTGGGKSTTISRMIGELQKADIATIVFDTEGEYTEIMNPTEDPTMRELLEQRSQVPTGVKNVQILRLVGRDGTNKKHKPQYEFSLSFDQLSPYAVMEILELNDAQQTRYLEAYDAAKQIMMQLSLYPKVWNEETQKQIFELDELEEGYPQLTLEKMYWVVRTIAELVSGNEDESIREADFNRNESKFRKLLKDRKNSFSKHPASWRKVQGALSKLLRLKIFDNADKKPDYTQITNAGQVTIIDLSDTTSPQINNLVITELLRGIQEQQENNYNTAQKDGIDAPRVVIMIEEAHEFLSRQRIKQMPNLFEQVAKIARRGRKRWLGMVFITQLPQHLPDEVLALINSYVLHKIGDANTISTLKRSIGGLDDAMWERVRNLTAGQAVVKVEGVSRPLMVTIDPTPHKLRMVD